MTDEYNLTWEQADAAMKLRAVVETKGYLPLRFKAGEYEFLDDKVWRSLGNSCELGKLTYKIHSIPECEDNYKLVGWCCGLIVQCKKCNSSNLHIERVRKSCIDNFMKRLCPFKNEEPKMSEELMSFDEAVAFLIKNPKTRLYYGDMQNIRFSDLYFSFYGTDDWKINPSSLRDFKFSKTPIKIEPKVNGLGLEENQKIDVSCKNFAIEKALKIYIELLKHPLVAKISMEDTQWVIVFLGSPFGLCEIGAIEYWNDGDKADNLSPVFDSEKDCKKAISDIGEEKLLFMFKTLKGL